MGWKGDAIGQWNEGEGGGLMGCGAGNGDGGVIIGFGYVSRRKILHYLQFYRLRELSRFWPGRLVPARPRHRTPSPSVLLGIRKRERERKTEVKRGRKHTSKFHAVPMMITLRIAFDRFALFNALSKANNKGSTHGVK